MVTSRPVKPLHMTPPTEDVVKAIEDIKTWADAPDPVFGVAAKRPTSGAFSGQHWFSTDTFTEYLWNGTTWLILYEPPQTYTPQVDQGATTNIAKTIVVAAYSRRGPFCKVWGEMNITAAGTAGASVTVTAPVAPVSWSLSSSGEALVYHAATSTRYVCQVEFTSGKMAFGADQGGGNIFWGAFPSIALANGDAIRWSVEYRYP